MKLQAFLFGIAFSILSTSTSSAQISFNSVSIRYGSIRTFLFEKMHNVPHYASYSELEVDANVMGPFLRWGLFWGYWNDGINSVLPVKDMVTYSYSSHIAGTRLIFLPKKVLYGWLLPVGIFAGASRHFIDAQCVGGEDYAGNTCNYGYQDFTRNINSLEFGLISEIHIYGPLNIQGEVQQFIPLGNNEFDRYQKNRRAYLIGFAVVF